MSKSGTLVRTAQRGDAAAVFSLIDAERRSGNLLLRTLEEIDFLIESERVYVAEDGGNVIGCAILEIYSKEMAEVRSLAVEERYRGNGIGEQLVRRCIFAATGEKVQTLLTVTGEQGFFEKLGFSPAMKSGSVALFLHPQDFAGAEEGPSVRRAVESEAVLIYVLVARAARDGRLRARSLAQIKERIRREPFSGGFFVALEGKKIVGCADLESYSERLWELRSLAVYHASRAEEFRRELTVVAAVESRNNGVGKLMVVVPEDEVMFFESLGFRTATRESRIALFLDLGERSNNRSG